MKKLYIIIFAIIFGSTSAQIGIGTDNIDPSAVLEVSSFNNKGVLFPRVDIVNILDNTKPVNNPSEGLVVFNKGNNISPGLYIWISGKWNLLADTYNLLNYLILQRTTDYTILGGSANGVYRNFNDINFNVVSNDINATYNSGTGVITLPGGSGYLVNLALNIKTVQESLTGGISSGRIHLHQYLVKLIDPISGIQYGDTVSINANSIASNKAHSINLSFSFAVDASTPISLLPAIAHDAGGTYQNALGGVAPNNGEIIITNAKLDVQKATIIQ